MLFNSFNFLLFFPLVVLIYFIVPKKIRYIWILVASYYFYMSWNAKYAILLIFCTLVTYIGGIAIELVSQCNKDKSKKYVVICIIINFTILVIFKYLGFFIDNVLMILGKFHINTSISSVNLLLPVGISFYTFQALGYIIDIYRGEVKAEHNILKYALFVSFFPLLIAGPIERSKNLLGQIERLDKLSLWNYERIKSGFLLMMWGLFQKIVIADRIALLVNNVFDNYREMGALEIMVAAVLFSFQIYCDFGGYSNLAKGTAEILGINLMNNFRQPYMAVSIKDFWRRWHISLTSWFTDYFYIPLGGNRKGRWRQYLNIMIVFLASGLWHGASWTYVIWGVLHGLYQIGGNVIHRINRNKRTLIFGNHFFQSLITFALTTFAWIFFRADTVGDAFGIIKRIFVRIRCHRLYAIGIDGLNWIILIFALIILFLVDYYHEKGISISKYFSDRSLLIQCVIYSGLISSILFFGIYGTGYDASQFIYFQF